MSDRAGRYWRTGQVGKNSKQMKVPILQAIMPVVIGLCEPGWLCLCWALLWHQSTGTELLPGSVWEGMAVARTLCPCLCQLLNCQRSEKELQPICPNTRAHPAALPRVTVPDSLLPKASRDRWDALAWIGLVHLFFQELGVINQGR